MADHDKSKPATSAPGLARESLGAKQGREPWPDGWYVYEQDGVVGPFNARDVFARAPTMDNGEPRLISRKGFSQWYPLADLADIYRFTDEVTQRRSKEMEQAQDALQKTIAATNAATKPKAKPEAKVQAKPIGPQPPSRNEVAAARERIADDQAQAQAQEAKAKINQTAAKVAAPPPTTIQPSTMPASVVSGPITKTPGHEYFVLRGRLRLGKIRNPWAVGLFGVPFSLGAYWVVWLTELSREINWHCSRNQQMGLGSMMLAMVPGLHCFVAYELASKIAGMERENKYQSISPMMAAILAIFPPAGVIYMQRAVNKHWLLHVASARRPQDAAQKSAPRSAADHQSVRQTATPQRTTAPRPMPASSRSGAQSPLQMGKKRKKTGFTGTSPR